MVKTKSLNLNVRTSRPVAPAGAAAEMFAVATIQALLPQVEEGEEKRKPIDVVVVLDKSGSMSGQKIDLCRNTVAFLIEHALGQEDRLGLVTFDSDVSRVFDLTRMTQEGKASCLAKVKAVQSGSNTNLSGGLFAGVEQVLRAPRPADVCAVLLLTDSQMNAGITDRAALARIMTGMLDSFPAGRTRPTVHTFGYGEDADVDALRAISDASSGMFYAVLTQEAVPLAFSNVIGGLQAITAQNLELSVELLGGASFSGKPLNKYTTKMVAPNHWTL